MHLGGPNTSSSNNRMSRIKDVTRANFRTNEGFYLEISTNMFTVCELNLSVMMGTLYIRCMSTEHNTMTMIPAQGSRVFGPD